MTFRESLKLFNLNDNYTKEEVQKAYKILIRKYHPDLHMNLKESEILALEEKCKE